MPRWVLRGTGREIPAPKVGGPLVGKNRLGSFDMVTYKCFKCEKKIVAKNLDKRFVCPNCGGKIFYKPRTKVKIVKAI